MWVLLAIGASIFWGLTYVFNEQIYKKISVLTNLGMVSLIVCIIALCISYFSGHLKPDIAEIVQSKRTLLYFIGGVAALLIAELCIGFSITEKNATLAGLIEISYPIFIALFGYLAFRSQVTVSTAIGGLMIFLGVFVIYYFNH